MLMTAADADKPLALRRDLDNFVQSLVISLIFMSPDFMPQLAGGQRMKAAEAEFLKRQDIASVANYRPEESLLLSLKTSDSFSGTSINSVDVIIPRNTGDLKK